MRLSYVNKLRDFAEHLKSAKYTRVKFEMQLTNAVKAAARSS
jgi:hypothetical protein